MRFFLSQAELGTKKNRINLLSGYLGDEGLFVVGTDELDGIAARHSRQRHAAARFHPLLGQVEVFKIV